MAGSTDAAPEGRFITLHFDDREVATMALNRDARKNALNDELMDEFSRILAYLSSRDTLRILVIRGNEDTFSAGLDVPWIADNALQHRGDDARRLAAALRQLEDFTRPVITLVRGPCYGAAMAVVACSDIVIAGESAHFALPAIRLGYVASVTAAYLSKYLGGRVTRRYMLTAEQFGADTARDLNLVDAVCMDERLDETAEAFIDHILQGAPQTLIETKALLNSLSGEPLDAAAIERLARRKGSKKLLSEAREGIDAFIAKRKPDWPCG